MMEPARGQMKPPSTEQKGAIRAGTVKETLLSDSEVSEHLSEMCQQVSKFLNDNWQVTLVQVCIYYQETCSKVPYAIGRTHLLEHKIYAPVAEPIKQKERRVPL